jgi:cysteinyl-tRNA synthetase
LTERKITAAEFQEIDQGLKEANRVLAIFDFPDRELPAEVRELLDQREQARQRKEFGEADRLRDQICARGYRIIDLKDKTLCTLCGKKDDSCPA